MARARVASRTHVQQRGRAMTPRSMPWMAPGGPKWPHMGPHAAAEPRGRPAIRGHLGNEKPPGPHGPRSQAADGHMAMAPSHGCALAHALGAPPVRHPLCLRASLGDRRQAIGDVRELQTSTSGKPALAARTAAPGEVPGLANARARAQWTLGATWNHLPSPATANTGHAKSRGRMRSPWVPARAPTSPGRSPGEAMWAQEQTGIPPRTRRRRQIARQFSSELRCNVAHRRQHRHPAVLCFCLPPPPEILHVAVRCEPGRVPEPHGILDPELILEGPQRRGRVQRPIAPSAACEAVLAGEREQATTPCTKGKMLYVPSATTKRVAKAPLQVSACATNAARYV